MKTARILYNPSAGRWASARYLDAVLAVFRSAGWDVTHYISHSRNDLCMAARYAAEEGLDICLVAGGDGSINAAIEGLVGSQTALGVLPVGTSNVLARDLGLPILRWPTRQTLAAMARALTGAGTRVVDVGWCDKRPFLMWGGLGLDALTVHALEPRPRIQKHLTVPMYAWTVLRILRRWHGQRWTVEADGRTVQGNYLLVVAGNIRRYLGGLATLSPQAFLDDGQMELWLFAGDSMEDALHHAARLLTGRHGHTSDDRVLCLPFRQAVVRSPQPFSVQVDGEPGPAECRECHLRVQQAGLHLLVPAPGLDLFFSEEKHV